MGDYSSKISLATLIFFCLTTYLGYDADTKHREHIQQFVDVTQENLAELRRLEAELAKGQQMVPELRMEKIEWQKRQLTAEKDIDVRRDNLASEEIRLQREIQRVGKQRIDRTNVLMDEFQEKTATMRKRMTELETLLSDEGQQFEAAVKNIGGQHEHAEKGTAEPQVIPPPPVSSFFQDVKVGEKVSIITSATPEPMLLSAPYDLDEQWVKDLNKDGIYLPRMVQVYFNIFQACAGFANEKAAYLEVGSLIGLSTGLAVQATCPVSVLEFDPELRKHFQRTIALNEFTGVTEIPLASGSSDSSGLAPAASWRLDEHVTGQVLLMSVTGIANEVAAVSTAQKLFASGGVKNLIVELSADEFETEEDHINVFKSLLAGNKWTIRFYSEEVARKPPLQVNAAGLADAPAAVQAQAKWTIARSEENVTPFGGTLLHSSQLEEFVKHVHEKAKKGEGQRMFIWLTVDPRWTVAFAS